MFIFVVLLVADCIGSCDSFHSSVLCKADISCQWVQAIYETPFCFDDTCFAIVEASPYCPSVGGPSACKHLVLKGANYGNLGVCYNDFTHVNATTGGKNSCSVKKITYGYCPSECQIYHGVHCLEAGLADPDAPSDCGRTQTYASCCTEVGTEDECTAFCDSHPNNARCLCDAEETFAACCTSSGVASGTCSVFCNAHSEDPGCLVVTPPDCIGTYTDCSKCDDRDFCPLMDSHCHWNNSNSVCYSTIPDGCTGDDCASCTTPAGCYKKGGSCYFSGGTKKCYDSQLCSGVDGDCASCSESTCTGFNPHCAWEGDACVLESSCSESDCESCYVSENCTSKGCVWNKDDRLCKASSSSTPLPAWAIYLFIGVGALGGLFCMIACFGACCYFCCCRNKIKKPDVNTAPAQPPQGQGQGYGYAYPMQPIGAPATVVSGAGSGSVAAAAVAAPAEAGVDLDTGPHAQPPLRPQEQAQEEPEIKRDIVVGEQEQE